ncbi:Rho-binding antiterminator [Granulosicoccus antarcticus]|uniref:Rho-binding antiterminator n=1 Tax=Granulosicoccus antarcticus IMCC3135 TaxID=1192854 RepID=A0A2Z2NV74_9GAMM|nr:Rho-binding antiterminator [Granulosicoccus antarcticus]ASJ73618.1 hypothetical protein IMCC3135_17695 [Granulosicoccus antarcticus IMCC3135]
MKRPSCDRRHDIDVEPYTPINCSDYDYIELACLDRCEVDIVKHEGVVRGCAVTTEKDSNGEYLIVQLENDLRESIRLDQIKQIVVRSEPRRFEERTFKPRS